MSNGLIAVAPVGDETNPSTNAVLLAKMAHHRITRHSEACVDVEDDRDLRMSIFFGESIGYVYNATVRGGNSKSRDKMSPLILSFEDFHKLPRDQQEICLSQKRQRNNRHGRAGSTQESRWNQLAGPRY